MNIKIFAEITISREDGGWKSSVNIGEAVTKKLSLPFQRFMVISNGPTIIIPPDGSLNRTYDVYLNQGKERQQIYLGHTLAHNAQEALRIVLTLKYQVDLEGYEIEVNNLGDGVWQIFIGAAEYTVKRK